MVRLLSSSPLILGAFLCQSGILAAQPLKVSAVWPLHATPQKIEFGVEPTCDLQPGDLLQSYRGLVPTGEFKVLKLEGPKAIASVIAASTQEASELLPHYPEVMIGDVLKPAPNPLVESVQITPEITLSYYDLFVDPKAHPQSMELTEDGRTLIRQKLAAYGSKRFPMLMIKSFTDEEGLASENQTETQERARSVREFVIEALGFDPQRVVAVGLGETELADRTKRPGFTQRNRRIIFKVIDPESADES